MKLIKPSFEIIEQSPGIEGVYKQIELAGRTCYKSLDKITEDSAKEFVDRMIKSGHGAMLEHGTVYLKFKTVKSAINPLDKYYHNKYSKICTESEHGINLIKEVFVTTNLRVLVENDWLDDLQYLCEPTEYHERRITVKFITDQGILREFTRHRIFSFAVESTRYCNYSKDKFGNEVTYIIPSWVNEAFPVCNTIKDDWGELFPEYYYKFTDLGKKEINYCGSRDLKDFIYTLSVCEKIYFSLLEAGWKPQQARNVLPLATKCDMVMTGFINDWQHFFNLRTPVNAHPQARELAIPLLEKFKELNYI